MEVEYKKTYIGFDSIYNIIKYQSTDVQRLLNIEHVNYLVNDQMEEYSKYQQFSIVQSITCADLDGKRYVLDGQHRIAAFRILKENFYSLDQYIPIVIYNVDSIEELQCYYLRINKHHPINPLENSDTWFKFGKQFCRWFTNEYKEYVKNSTKKSNCPHINLQEMMLYIKNKSVFERLKINYELIDFINKIKDVNCFFVNNYENIMKYQLTTDFTKRIKKCYEKNQQNVCFLGIWRQFEWIELVLHLLANHLKIEDINLSSFNNDRQKIPKNIRYEVWCKRNNTSFEGKCYVCESDLHYENMECGHIVPHVYGGVVHKDNLEPICKTCNRDMGIINLNEYKNIYNQHNEI